MILLIGSQKGGCGKFTIAVNTDLVIDLGCKVNIRLYFLLLFQYVIK